MVKLAKKLDEVSIVSDAARKLADKAEAAYDASATASIAAESKVLYEKDKRLRGYDYETSVNYIYIVVPNALPDINL
mgnify:CR=1 FL=1